MQYIICLLFYLPTAAYGAEHYLTESQLIKEFQAFGAFRKLSAHFDQVRTVKAWDSQIKTRGSFSMRKGNQSLILWEIEYPTYTAIKINQQGVFIKSSGHSGPWNPIQSAKVKEQIQSIFAWMSFDAQRISKDFVVTKPFEFVYELAPKNKKTHFKKITIRVNPEKTVQSITMFEDNQDRIQIDFKDTKIL